MLAGGGFVLSSLWPPTESRPQERGLQAACEQTVDAAGKWESNRVHLAGGRPSLSLSITSRVPRL
jgi:hypothetical protein